MAHTKTGAAIVAKGTYEMKSWDEKTWDGKAWNEVSGARMTHARVGLAYHGDLEAEAAVQFLMSYQSDNAAAVVGLQQITGQIGGRSGSFVLQDTGKFEKGVATSSVSVVPGSGTGDFAGLRGSGTASAEHDGTLSYAFEFLVE